MDCISPWGHKESDTTELPSLSHIFTDEMSLQICSIGVDLF